MNNIKGNFKQNINEIKHDKKKEPSFFLKLKESITYSIIKSKLR